MATINKKHANPEHLPQLKKMHKGIRAISDAAALCDACQLILIAVPVDEVRLVMRTLAPHLDGSHVVVHAVRGLETDTFAQPSAIIAAESYGYLNACLKACGGR